jgi:hypothetical protein
MRAFCTLKLGDAVLTVKLALDKLLICPVNKEACWCFLITFAMMQDTIAFAHQAAVKSKTLLATLNARVADSILAKVVIWTLRHTVVNVQNLSFRARRTTVAKRPIT